MHRTLKHTNPPTPSRATTKAGAADRPVSRELPRGGPARELLGNGEGPQGQRNVEIQSGWKDVAEPQKCFNAYLLAR